MTTQEVSERLRRWLGYQLRRWADRIDPDGAPRCTGLSFTFEKYRGIVIDMEGRQGRAILEGAT